MDDGRLIDGDPKSRVGIRAVAFPADIVPELADHLERFAEANPNGLVFTGPRAAGCAGRTSATPGAQSLGPEPSARSGERRFFIRWTNRFRPSQTRSRRMSHCRARTSRTCPRTV
jgi:hypothetical protein